MAYTGNTQTSCQTQDLTQVRSYDAARSGCNSFSFGSSMQLTKCMASSNLVNVTVSTYTTTDCTGVADNTPHVFVPCGSPGFTTMWGTCADSSPTPESSCALQNKNFFEYLTQTTRLALCKLQAKTVWALIAHRFSIPTQTRDSLDEYEKEITHDNSLNVNIN